MVSRCKLITYNSYDFNVYFRNLCANVMKFYTKVMNSRFMLSICIQNRLNSRWFKRVHTVHTIHPNRGLCCRISLYSKGSSANVVEFTCPHSHLSCFVSGLGSTQDCVVLWNSFDLYSVLGWLTCFLFRPLQVVVLWLVPSLDLLSENHRSWESLLLLWWTT